MQEIGIINEVRLASLHDIAAMKLNAIIANGTRLKDFIDIACLSSYLTFNEMLKAYEHKYNARNQVLVVKCLSFFDDINRDEPIMLLNTTYTWDLIEGRIIEMIEQPECVFGPM